MDERELDLQLADALDELKWTRQEVIRLNAENQQLIEKAMRLQSLVQEALVMYSNVLKAIQ